METLQDFFKEKGLSQDKAAKALGLAQAAVSKHIRGMGMRMSTAVLYHEKLGVPMDVLLKNSTPQTQEQR
jgi:predicted transcriptional regulator